jgi:hypothetical protein
MDCPNGQYCDLGSHGCIPNATDASVGTSCMGNADCGAATPICDTGTCRTCALDDECDSGVCRADGACEPSDNVLYVATNGVSAGTCSQATPCELMFAKSLVTSTRYSIRVANGTYSLPGAFVVSSPIGHVAIIGGRSAVFERGATGPSFDVRSGSKLTLRGVTLHRGLECNSGMLDIDRVAFNTPGAESRSWVLASNCTTTTTASELEGSTALGIDATSLGTVSISSTTIRQSANDGVRAQQLDQLTIAKSTIAENLGLGVNSTAQQTTIRASNLYSNRMGGISSVNGVYDVTNNFVYRNGNAASSLFGGMRLESIVVGNRVEHNTVVRNDAEFGATPTLAGGVYCRGGGTSANNLITNNFYGNAAQSNAQVAGTCTFTGSLVLESDATARFVSSVAEPFDYHLADTQSAAVGVGIVSNPPITDDFDGEPRDTMPDVGADELGP